MKKSKLLALAIVACMLLSAFAGCAPAPAATTAPSSEAPAQASASPTPTEAPTVKPIVTIYSIYPGDAPKGLEPVLAAINERLGADIGVNIQLGWAPWDQYANKYTLAIQSGDKIDYLWAGSSACGQLTNDSLIMPIDDQLAQFGAPIYANIDKTLFGNMNIGGKQMGVPSTGNGPLVNIYHDLIYREDLRIKYNLPELNSLDNVELFLKTIKEQETGMTPIISSNIMYPIWPAFGPEDGITGTGGMVQAVVNDDGSVTCMPNVKAKAYIGAVNKVREWFNLGYIPADIQNVMGDAQNRLNAGTCAMIGGGALAAAESQATISANIPGALLSEAPFFSEKKWIYGDGGNALYVTANSKAADQCVQFWAWVFTNQDNFDLYCYGVKDVNYAIDNNRVVIKDTGYVGFPGWMFKNMNFLRFTSDVTDAYIDKIKHWNDGASISPLMGFSFDPTKNVSAEYAACNAVVGQYGPSLAVGANDPAPVLAEFEQKLKDAGIEKVVAECQAQVDAYIAAHK